MHFYKLSKRTSVARKQKRRNVLNFSGTEFHLVVCYAYLKFTTVLRQLYTAVKLRFHARFLGVVLSVLVTSCFSSVTD